MSEDDGKTTEAREEELSDPRRRQGAQKLSALLRARDDEAVGRFRKQHLRGEPVVEIEELIAARTLLEHLVRAFEGGEADWALVVQWARELAADDASSKAETLDDEEEEERSEAEEPNTATVPRPPQLFDPLPPDDALPARRDEPSPWTSWSQPSPRGSAPSTSSAATPPTPPSATPSVPPAAMPSNPPSATPSVPPAAMPSTPPSATPSVPPSAMPSVPAPGAELRSGAPMRPRPKVPNAETLADVTAPPGHLERALPFVAPEEGQTQHLVCYSMAHGLALSLRQYAALCAESDASPQRRHLVHERYHVGDTRTWHLLRKAYELRFEADPSLRAQWQEHYDRFRAALRGSR